MSWKPNHTSIEDVIRNTDSSLFKSFMNDICGIHPEVDINDLPRVRDLMLKLFKTGAAMTLPIKEDTPPQHH